MKKIGVNSNCPEFGYELLSAVPYAYHLHLKGELDASLSSYDTKCLYFFNPNHIESNCRRSWNNMNKLWKTNFPNIHIHRKELDWNLFSAPPFKEFYKNDAIKFEKETLVIFNRYNNEWGRPPINYLDLKTLENLFMMLENKYQIVYINIKGHHKYYDGVDALDLGDDKLLKKHPKVISINDLIEKYPGLTYNEIQLRVFANCEKYISSNGGQLILSAYFGGENIIFSKECREISKGVNSFNRWYHRLGGGIFQHVDNYEDLLELVKEKWLDKKPLFNILIRTSDRPKYFDDCVKSIYEQTYKNWQIIIGIDKKETENYTVDAKGRTVYYNFDKIKISPKPKNDNYGVPFKYNLYFNELHKHVQQGYIIYLDDDDALFDKNSLYDLAQQINDEDTLVFWRVQFPNRLVPSNQNFEKSPVLKDISGIGFTFPNKYKLVWEPFKRGDYRIAKKLTETIPKKVYFNKIITKLQRDIEDGFGRRDDKDHTSEVVEIKREKSREKIKKIFEVNKKDVSIINYDRVNQTQKNKIDRNSAPQIKIDKLKSRTSNNWGGHFTNVKKGF